MHGKEGQRYALCEDHIGELGFLWLKLSGQLFFPVLQAAVELAELLKLNRLTTRPSNVVGMIKEEQQIAADLAELHELQARRPRPRGLLAGLVRPAVGVGRPRLGVFVRKHVVLRHVEATPWELGQPPEVVGPGLVEQEAPPERDPAGVHLLLVQRALALACAADVEVQANVLRHAETHAAVHPPLGLSPAASLPHRHERQRLHSGEPWLFVLVVLDD